MRDGLNGEQCLHIKWQKFGLLVGLGFWPFSPALNKPAQNEEEKHRAGNPATGAAERESGHNDCRCAE